MQCNLVVVLGFKLTNTALTLTSNTNINTLVSNSCTLSFVEYYPNVWSIPFNHVSDIIVL